MLAKPKSPTVEPFTQQIISFLQQLARSQDGTANATLAYSLIFPMMGVNSPQFRMDAPMMLSIYSGVFHPANVSIEPVAPDCTTGNCTFPEFLSIAVCAKGADITHLLHASSHRNNTPDTLPNGMSMDLTVIANISTSSYPKSFATLAFPNVTDPLANIFVIFRNPHLGAAEFVFEYCIKRYHTVVSNGRPHTDNLATYTNHTILNKYADHMVNDDTTLNFSVPNSPMTYITVSAQIGMQNFLHNLFQGTVSLFALDSDIAGPDIVGPDIAGPILDAIRDPPFNQTGMQGLIDNVAMSITNNIRSRNNNNGSTGRGAPLQGIAYGVVPFVHVQWEWLSVLAVLELLALVLLVSTVLQSRHARMKLWKSSSLAVLRAGAGADEGLRGNWAVGGMGRMGVMEMQGKGVGIMLVNETKIGGGGWRLVKGD